MRNKKSVISVTLALAMVFTFMASLFSVSAAAYTLVERTGKAYDIDEGARYTEYDLTSGVNGNTEVANMVTFSSADYIPMVFTCYAGTATQLKNQYSAAVNKYGYDVIGAMNGSFFDMSNGMLIGLNVSNGKITCAHAGYSDEVVAFSSDGHFDVVKSNISYTLTIDGRDVPNGIYYINKTPGKNGTFGDRFYYFDASCGSVCDTYESTPGYEVVCRKINNTELVVGGTLVGEVLEVRTDSYGYRLSDDYNTVSDKFVLFVKNGSSYADYVKDLEAGSKVEINAAETVASSVEIMENASSVITNVGWLVKDGVDQTEIQSTIGTHSVTLKARWNAFGIKEDGTYVFFTSEGGSSGSGDRSVTLKDVAKVMKDAGCVNVIRMDGGGSVGLYLKDDGTGQPGYRTSSSRAISDCILIVRRPQPSDELTAEFDRLLTQAELALDNDDDPELLAVVTAAKAVRLASTSTSGDYTREVMRLGAFFSGGAALTDAINKAKSVYYGDYSAEQLEFIRSEYDYALAVKNTKDATPSAIKEAAERLLASLDCNKTNLALGASVRIVGGKITGTSDTVGYSNYKALLNDGQAIQNGTYTNDWFAFFVNSNDADNSVSGVSVDGVTYNVGTAVLDFGSAKTWSNVRVNTWAAGVSGIAAPSRMIVSSSDNGTDWTYVGDLKLGAAGSIYWAESEFAKTTSRYLKLQVCWIASGGVFTFINEIEVYESFDKVSNVGWVNGFNQKITAGSAYIFTAESTPDLNVDVANVNWSQTLYLTWDAAKGGYKVSKIKSPNGAEGGTISEGTVVIGVHDSQTPGDPDGSTANRAYASKAKVGDYIEFYGIYTNTATTYPGSYYRIVSASDFNKKYNGIYNSEEYDIPTSTLKPLTGTINLVPEQVYEKTEGNGVQPVYSFDPDGVMTVTTEKSGGWPCVHTDYAKPLMVDFNKAEIELDFTVSAGGETSILLFVNDGQYIKLSQNVGGSLGAGNGDLYSGTYKVTKKLSEIKAYDQSNEAANHYQGQVELLPDSDGNITFTGITIFATGSAVVTIRSIKIYVPEAKAGDLNGDNKVTSDDAVLLLRHILFPENYPIDKKIDLDFNSDGAVNSDDAVYLLRHTLFPEDYALHPKKYTVTWKNFDGAVLGTDRAAENSVPRYKGETPFRDPDSAGSYTFTGWDPAPAKIASDAEYTAVYSSKAHTYGDWVVDTPAGEITTGSKHRECTECGYRETAVIPAEGGDGVGGSGVVYHNSGTVKVEYTWVKSGATVKVLLVVTNNTGAEYTDTISVTCGSTTRSVMVRKIPAGGTKETVTEFTGVNEDEPVVKVK